MISSMRSRTLYIYNVQQDIAERLLLSLFFFAMRTHIFQSSTFANFVPNISLFEAFVEGSLANRDTHNTNTTKIGNKFTNTYAVSHFTGISGWWINGLLL